MSFPFGVLGQRQKLALPVDVVRYARSDAAHLVQHAWFADPTEPAVHLEVHADVLMQRVQTNGEGSLVHWASQAVSASASRHGAGGVRGQHDEPGVGGAKVV